MPPVRFELTTARSSASPHRLIKVECSPRLSYDGISLKVSKQILYNWYLNHDTLIPDSLSKSIRYTVIWNCFYLIMVNDWGMSYQPDDTGTGLFSSMPGKRMAFLVMRIIIGAFFGVQAMFGFPIYEAMWKTKRKVVTKSEGTCVVIGSDQHPRSIPNCQYKVGDILSITYKQETSAVEKYKQKG